MDREREREQLFLIKKKDSVYFIFFFSSTSQIQSSLNYLIYTEAIKGYNSRTIINEKEVDLDYLLLRNTD